MLTYREKKLVVAWRAEMAVVDALVQEFGNGQIRRAMIARRDKLDPVILSAFDLEERAEIDKLDAQIPKE